MLSQSFLTSFISGELTQKIFLFSSIDPSRTYRHRSQNLGEKIHQKLNAADQRRADEVKEQAKKLQARHAQVHQAKEQKRKLGASSENLHAPELQSRPKIARD